MFCCNGEHDEGSTEQESEYYCSDSDLDTDKPGRSV